MLPINHLKRTLDRCCGQWEFYNSPTQDTFRVKFLNTDEHYIAEYVEQRWHVSIWDSKTAFWSFDPFLSNRLNGHTRDDAGNVAGDGDRRVEGEWQIIRNPPPNLIIEAGDEYWSLSENDWHRFSVSIGKTVGETLYVSGEEVKIRRRIHGPIYETPDKVVQ